MTGTELTPEMLSMEVTAEARAVSLADEATWALAAGLFEFNPAGSLTFTDYGKIAVGLVQSVVALDCDEARELDVYVNGLRLHWLAVALGTGEPVEAIDFSEDGANRPTDRVLFDTVIEMLRTNESAIAEHRF